MREQEGTQGGEGTPGPGVSDRSCDSFKPNSGFFYRR